MAAKRGSVVDANVQAMPANSDHWRENGDFMPFDETQSVANTAQPSLGRGARINHFDPAAISAPEITMVRRLFSILFLHCPGDRRRILAHSVAHAMILSHYEIEAFGVPMLLSLHGICRR